MRFVHGHHARKLIPRFVETPDTNCWLWQLSKTSDGYGRAYVGKGRELKAYRVVFEELVGPVPDGLTLDHLCRNRACVNPGHLEPTTMRTNILRGDGFAAINARKTHCKRGHPLTGENMYIDGNGARVCRTCKRAAWRRYYKRRRAAAL